MFKPSKSIYFEEKLSPTKLLANLRVLIPWVALSFLSLEGRSTFLVSWSSFKLYEALLELDREFCKENNFYLE